PRNLVLDRIFGREYVDIGLVDAIQAPVERGCLAATGWTGHENDSVGSLDEVSDQMVVALGEAQLTQIEQHIRLVQQTHHDALVVATGWNRRNANVDAAPCNLE